jgi:hypothetical protein
VLIPVYLSLGNRCTGELREAEALMGKGKLGVLDDAQKQLGRLVRAAESKNSGVARLASNLATVESELRRVISNTIPGRLWPDSLEVIPQVHMELMHLYLGAGDRRMAIRHGLKGALTPRRQPVGNWVNSMLSLTINLMPLADAAPGDGGIADSDFPSPSDMFVTLMGYYWEVTKAARRSFGPDTKFVALISEAFAEAQKKCGELVPGTQAFARHFGASQDNLLQWAGVNGNYAIVLTDGA